MNLHDFDRITWKRPWMKISPGATGAYELELSTETCPQHPLYGVKTKAIARACNGDDVLFLLKDHTAPLAMVHLTFTRKLEPNPLWPTVKFYDSLEVWESSVLNPEIAQWEERLKKRRTRS